MPETKESPVNLYFNYSPESKNYYDNEEPSMEPELSISPTSYHESNSLYQGRNFGINKENVLPNCPPKEKPVKKMTFASHDEPPNSADERRKINQFLREKGKIELSM